MNRIALHIFLILCILASGLCLWSLSANHPMLKPLEEAFHWAPVHSDAETITLPLKKRYSDDRFFDHRYLLLQISDAEAIPKVLEAFSEPECGERRDMASGEPIYPVTDRFHGVVDDGSAAELCIGSATEAQDMLYDDFEVAISIASYDDPAFVVITLEPKLRELIDVIGVSHSVIEGKAWMIDGMAVSLFVTILAVTLALMLIVESLLLRAAIRRFGAIEFDGET